MKRKKKKHSPDECDAPLAIYLKQIGAIPLLSAAEETAAAERIAAARRNYRRAILANDDARNQIIERLEDVQNGKLQIGRVMEISAGSAAEKHRLQQLLSTICENARVWATEQVIDFVEQFPVRQRCFERAAEAASIESAVAGERSAYERAKNVLTSANLRLVVSIAKRYQNRGIDLEELIQAGNTGLMRVVDKFDPDRGFKFSTFAKAPICKAIVDEIDSQGGTIKLTSSAGDAGRKIERARVNLWYQHEREPTTYEIGEAVGMSHERVAEILRSSQGCISLDQPAGSTENATLGGVVAMPDWEELDGPERELLLRGIRSLLPCLTGEEQQVISLQYGLDDVARDADAIADVLGIELDQVEQIRKTAIGKLRKAARSKSSHSKATKPLTDEQKTIVAKEQQRRIDQGASPVRASHEVRHLLSEGKCPGLDEGDNKVVADLAADTIARYVGSYTVGTLA